jgi:hypothetical protein
VLVGRDGEGYVSPVAVSGERVVSTDSVRLPTRPDCRSEESVVLSELELTRRDGRLVGSGKGRLNLVGGDSILSSDVTLTLSGELDDTPPAVIARATTFSPLDFPSVEISEPLGEAELSWVGVSSLPLSGSAPLVALSAKRLLPFGGTWQLSGEARDLAGLLLPVGQAITTIPDPGVFASDGFEGPVLGLLNGQARRIGTTDGLPIPTGQHALLVTSSSYALLHLRRTASEQNLVFKAVRLTKNEAYEPSNSEGEVRVGVIGAAATHPADWTAKADQETGHAEWQLASAAVEIRVPLVDAGTDVVIDLLPRAYRWPVTRNRALVIDDLRLE